MTLRSERSHTRKPGSGDAAARPLTKETAVTIRISGWLPVLIIVAATIVSVNRNMRP